MNNPIEIEVSPVFHANYEAFYDKQWKVIANQGGTRSGKTYSIMQLLVLHANSHKDVKISIVSSTLPHIKKGVLRDFATIMKHQNLFDDKRFNKTDYIYQFSTGSYIEFFSADKSDKLRGPGRHILFINEANLLTHDEYRELILRTTEKVIIDYNPVDEYCWLYDHVLTRDDCKFIQSCYLDNYDFLPQSQIEEIERLRDTDSHYWEIYGLGNVAKAMNLIYSNFSVQNYQARAEPIYGIDFGYNSPAAVVQVQKENNTLYVKQLIYETDLLVPDLIHKLKECIPNKLAYIYADSADPDKIQEIKNAGFNIWPANKSNVKVGLHYLKRFTFVIDPSSTDLIKEIKSYKWKQDKDEKLLDEPVKYNDHAMDALRYAAYSHGIKHWAESNFTIPNVHLNKHNRRQNKYSEYL